MKLFKLLIISIFLLFISVVLEAQIASNLLTNNDLSSFKVDALTETELNQMQAQLKQAGLTINQLEQQAIAKGMSATEFTKLKQKLNSLVKGGANNINKSPLTKLGNKKLTNTNPTTDSTNFEFIEPYKTNPLIYGSELFNQNTTGYASNQNLATPLNYILGPGDILTLVVFGVQEYNNDLTVTKEGRITIENVGQVKVAGLSIEAAADLVKSQMANTAYPSIKNGKTKIALTLGNIRTVQVTIIGARKSGRFNVSSLSNVLAVLAEAGGPYEIGSYREIELIRDNKVFKKIDLYDFMKNGDQTNMVTVKDNDIIRIPPYKNRFELKGQVKRPGIFEITKNESFNSYLQYAGGFDDTAYTAWVKIIQKNDKEKAVKDLAAVDYLKYVPQGGDIIHVAKILDRFQNRVKLSGAVFRPDVYELTPGMHISELIQRADGLREDAFLGRAQLIRLKPNLLKELITINLSKALQKNTIEDIELKREDELYVNSVLDLRDSLTVDLLGEVRTEGKFNYLDSMTVKDLILMAGGFTFAAHKQVEVARQIQYDENVNSNKVATILKTEINDDLSFKPGQENFVLQPMDVVTITKKVGFVKPEVVTISGQVQSEGKYTLSSRVDRVSDIVERSGGLISDAYSEGAFIKRSRNNIDSLKSDETKTSVEEAYNRKFKAQQDAEKENLSKIANATSTTNKTSLLDQNLQKKKLKDTLDILIKEMEDDYYQIAIDINQIIKNPGSAYDLILRDKDEIVIPKIDNRVKISGGVLRPTNIVYREGLTIGECISAAGGISEYAQRRRAYVVYANGKSNRTKYFGLFRINPIILPGSEVVLPETNEKKEKTVTTFLQFTTIIAQLVSAIATISILKK